VAAVLLNKLWCDYFITKIPGKMYYVRVTGIYLWCTEMLTITCDRNWMETVTLDKHNIIILCQLH